MNLLIECGKHLIVNTLYVLVASMAFQAALCFILVRPNSITVIKLSKIVSWGLKKRHKCLVQKHGGSAS